MISTHLQDVLHRPQFPKYVTESGNMTAYVQRPPVVQAAKWDGDWTAFLDAITPSPWGGSFTKVDYVDGSVDIASSDGTNYTSAVRVHLGEWYLPRGLYPYPPGVPSGQVLSDTDFHATYLAYGQLYVAEDLPGGALSWIVATGSDGRVTIPLPAGVFASAPAVTATVLGTTDAQVRMVELESVTTTAIVVRTFTSQNVVIPGLLSPVTPIAATVHVTARPTN